jgi:hypothetical protein
VRSVAKQALQRIMPSDATAPLFVTKALILAILGYYGGKAFFFLVERHFLNSPAVAYVVEPLVGGEENAATALARSAQAP